MYDPLYIIASPLHFSHCMFDDDCLKLSTFSNRDEVAACIEKSYDNITFKEATRMLFFQNDMNMKEFSAKVG